MARFIYLTDTHIGADPIGYHQQPAYPKYIKQLLQYLQLKIKEQSIDFIIHGGDLVDHCEPEIIKSAEKLFNQLSVPTYLCLGNHDVDQSDALNIWLDNAPSLFINHSPNYEIITKPSVIHVVPNHWNRKSEFYWEELGIQEPRLSNSQIEQLKKNIEKYPNKTHIIVTHSPVYGMSTEQSGLQEVLHKVPVSFQETMNNLIDLYPNIKLILSGHSHFNTIKKIEQAIFVNGSSFVETPFEYKVIEITDTYVKIDTHQIDIDNEFYNFEYNQKRAYVQGRDCDRRLMWNF